MLSLLAEVLADENSYGSAQMLLEFVQEQGVTWELELPEMERVLDTLFVRDLLERDRVGEGQSEYRFRVDLFRHWVRLAHSVWQR